MTGALTVLESGDACAEEQARLLGALRHGTEVMCDITNDFLDINALRLGLLRLNKTWTHVRELLDGCVQPRKWGV